MAELPYAIEQPDGADVGEVVLPRRRKFAREDLAREENCRSGLSLNRRHDKSSSRWQGRPCHRRTTGTGLGDAKKFVVQGATGGVVTGLNRNNSTRFRGNGACLGKGGCA